MRVLKASRKASYSSNNRHSMRFALMCLVLLISACGGGGGGGSDIPENTGEVVELDNDNDGVINNLDTCLNTPATLANEVDTSGCHISEITDTDNDAVFDIADMCETTPSNLIANVNINGCHVEEITDTDNDMVFNVSDICPTTPVGLTGGVNTEGCHLDEVTDTDSDGVANSIDLCPNTATNTTIVNAQGCADTRIEHNVKALNVGYLEFMSEDGMLFERDTGFTWSKERRGAIITNGNNVTGTRDIVNTTDDDLFRYHRFLENNDISYQIPLVNGSYHVRLYFAEMILANRSGDRVFDVTAEGTMLFDNLDIYASVGASDTAYIVSSEEFEVNDGILNLRFISQTGNPIISAIQVYQRLEPNDDEDGDFVTNINDQCVYTPAAFVGVIDPVSGCANEELDLDNDGVTNSVDTCPATPNLQGFPITDSIIDSNGCSLADLDADNDGVSDDLDLCPNTSNNVGVNTRGCSLAEAPLVDQPFQEENGLAVIEMESTNYPSGWQLKTGYYSTGNKYLLWQGAWNPSPSGTAADGFITIDVQIDTPGVYQVIWRNLVGKRILPSEHNDSWLKITSSSTPMRFFASNTDNTMLVCPPNADATNTCVQNGTLRGNNGGSYFKTFRNQRPTFDWSWTTRTNDADALSLYAEFDSPGVYQINVEARSAFHGIDRIVLFRDEDKNTSGPMMSAEQAFNISLPESARVPL